LTKYDYYTIELSNLHMEYQVQDDNDEGKNVPCRTMYYGSSNSSQGYRQNRTLLTSESTFKDVMIAFH